MIGRSSVVHTKLQCGCKIQSIATSLIRGLAKASDYIRGLRAKKRERWGEKRTEEESKAWTVVI